MKVYTKIEYIWNGSQYVSVSEKSYDYPENGQVALCKGASEDQRQLNDSQTKLYNTISSDYNEQFANQSNILQSLNNSLAPIVSAGPNQYGFNKAQENTLNSQATEGTAQQYQHAQRVLQNQQAAHGGGTMYLPSGVDAQNDAALAASGANQMSSQLLGIKQAGYEQGNRNYNNAVAAMGGVASQYNPTGYASTANSAGNSAAAEANLIQQEDQASNPWGTVGGLLGGVAGSFLGPVGTALGSKFGSMLGGMGGGSSSGVASLTGNAGSVG